MPVENVEKQIQALDLSASTDKGITLYFDSADSLRSRELAALAADMATYFDKEFNIRFDFKVAALQPRHWFSEFPGIPYAIPWPYFPDRIILMPASLDEGIMVVKDRTRQENKWFVDFVLVHEYAHFLEKDFFRPTDDDNYMRIKWFGEFVANYFAYAYIHTADQTWANEVKRLWTDHLSTYTPAVFSLDWSFMQNLPPQDLGPTYAWYQVMLNLKAAEVYETYGLDFLFTIKEDFAWQDSKKWTSPSLVFELDNRFPGFTTWAEHIESFAKE